MGNEPRRSLTAGKPLYIEILIQASLERVWALSQDPQAHPRWDLRFSRIIPLEEDQQRQVRFRYEFALPGHPITGTGTSLGDRHRADGQATSVLKFATDDPLSPIGPGAGYWRYIPTADGLRFITGYGYTPGLGKLGQVLDPRVIRPMLGWATALSFDRLRLWAESDLDPRRSRNRWFLDAGGRAVGVLVAGELVRRGLAQRSVTLTVGGAALGATACLVATHWSVPRARRCLRHAPDERSARAPASLAHLPEPGATAGANQQPHVKE